jgi:hypothetical protein
MRCVRARIASDLRSDAKWVNSEHRKNGKQFPVPRAIHQRFVAQPCIFKGDGTVGVKKKIEMAADGSSAVRVPNKKAGAGPAFFRFGCQIGARSVLRRDQYLGMIGPPKR